MPFGIPATDPGNIAKVSPTFEAYRPVKSDARAGREEIDRKKEKGAGYNITIASPGVQVL